MSNELKLDIKKLQNSAILSLIAILLTIISIIVGISFLFVPSFVAIILFAIATICIVYLLHSNRTARKQEKEVHKPVIFRADIDFSFEKIVTIFERITDKGNRLSTCEDVRFFRFHRIFKARTILYRTSDFNKKEFDNAKDRINKKANRELSISHWVDRTEASKMMRFNVIFTDRLNGALYQFISQNANRNLTRVEGIINIAVVGNQVILPPFYGRCDLLEISRYKRVIRFIDQMLLNTTEE